MQRKNDHQSQEPATGKHEYPLPGQISSGEKEKAAAAHEAAEKDIQKDEPNTPNPNEDLDEGESARLGEEHTDLI